MHQHHHSACALVDRDMQHRTPPGPKTYAEVTEATSEAQSAPPNRHKASTLALTCESSPTDIHE